MTHDQECVDFLVQFTAKNKLEDYIDHCSKHKRTSDNNEINVLSAAILEILNEIEHYINLYEEKIEKGFGVDTEKELERIYEEVFSSFLDLIGQPIRTTENRMHAVSVFIKDWDKFVKEEEIYWNN